MPSEEFVAVIREWDEARSTKARIAVLENMWLLQDPEIIEAVTLIYNDGNEDRKVRAKAAEVLGKYKGLYQALRAPKKAGGGGRAGLRNMLVITLVLLLGANGALFFMGSSDGEDGDSRDLVAERKTLIDQIEADMTTVRELAIDLRATSRDLEEESTSLEDACNKSFSDVPTPIVLAENQTGFFPDINTFVTDPIGDYLVALDGAAIALTTWNAGCTVQMIDTDRVIDIAAAVVDSADAALNIRLPDLRDNPFVTPTPSPRPTNAPTDTPIPTETPLPRDRNTIIARLYEIVDHAEVNANIIQTSTSGAIRGEARLRDYCSQVLWTDIELVTLTGDEVVAAPEVADYLAAEDNSFNALVTQSKALRDEWNRLCNGSPRDAEVDALNTFAQNVLDQVTTTQTGLLNSIGPNPAQ